MAGIAEALAFDLYGTLADPSRIWRQLEQHVAEEALRVSELRCQKQLEYTFRLTAMEQYQSFDMLCLDVTHVAPSESATKIIQHYVIERQ